MKANRTMPWRYRETLQSTPDSVPANIAAGSVLDLLGKGEEARKYFSKAIEVADTQSTKPVCKQRSRCPMLSRETATKQLSTNQQVFDDYGSVRNFFRQGEVADEAARVCNDSGDLAQLRNGTRSGTTQA